jgi:hypothetical protein
MRQHKLKEPSQVLRVDLHTKTLQPRLPKRADSYLALA